ncbi:hypothetical protein [Nocardiopsis suaedae]|uniref:Uncharacterized protein n=1 Tax=Nocardiopsis suaedae TaxID=3018444 RepID=A0ABT4TEU3_9ACTN|nr:hypothetical protein [Nocardiopsis suaedae]MDA2803229.1 hypothetical protein [Nocardiopsis suaedae]
MPVSVYTGSPFHPLFALAKELEARGLGTAVDTSVSVVDAYIPDPDGGDSARLRGCPFAFQRAVLRADAVSARPWWWLLWPGQRFEREIAEPEMTRLLPVEEYADLARRIESILAAAPAAPARRR